MLAAGPASVVAAPLGSPSSEGGSEGRKRKGKRRHRGSPLAVSAAAPFPAGHRKGSAVATAQKHYSLGGSGQLQNPWESASRRVESVDALTVPLAMGLESTLPGSPGGEYLPKKAKPMSSSAFNNFANLTEIKRARQRILSDAIPASAAEAAASAAAAAAVAGSTGGSGGSAADAAAAGRAPGRGRRLSLRRGDEPSPPQSQSPPLRRRSRRLSASETAGETAAETAAAADAADRRRSGGGSRRLSWALVTGFAPPPPAARGPASTSVSPNRRGRRSLPLVGRRGSLGGGSGSAGGSASNSPDPSRRGSAESAGAAAAAAGSASNSPVVQPRRSSRGVDLAARWVALALVSRGSSGSGGSGGGGGGGGSSREESPPPRPSALATPALSTRESSGDAMRVRSPPDWSPDRATAPSSLSPEGNRGFCGGAAANGGGSGIDCSTSGTGRSGRMDGSPGERRPSALKRSSLDGCPPGGRAGGHTRARTQQQCVTFALDEEDGAAAASGVRGGGRQSGGGGGDAAARSAAAAAARHSRKARSDEIGVVRHNYRKQQLLPPPPQQDPAAGGSFRRSSSGQNAVPATLADSLHKFLRGVQEGRRGGGGGGNGPRQHSFDGSAGNDGSGSDAGGARSTRSSSAASMAVPSPSPPSPSSSSHTASRHRKGGSSSGGHGSGGSSSQHGSRGGSGFLQWRLHTRRGTWGAATGAADDGTRNSDTQRAPPPQPRRRRNYSTGGAAWRGWLSPLLSRARRGSFGANGGGVSAAAAAAAEMSAAAMLAAGEYPLPPPPPPPPAGQSYSDDGGGGSGGGSGTTSEPTPSASTSSASHRRNWLFGSGGGGSVMAGGGSISPYFSASVSSHFARSPFFPSSEDQAQLKFFETCLKAGIDVTVRDRQGNSKLRTLFLDADAKHLCWVRPGLATLSQQGTKTKAVPLADIVEFRKGTAMYERCLYLVCGRHEPIIIEPGTDYEYETLRDGLHRLVESRQLLRTDTDAL